MRRREPAIWLLAAAILVTGVGAAFWLPGFARAGGHFPVPLDDVYIHFGFARSAALGHPFAWIPGNGYSSGGTSLTYPLVLAPGWLLGMRGERLAIFAAALAIACLVDLARSLRALLAGAPRWIAWAAPALLLSVPLLDWSLFSGMETALLAAILGRALVAVRDAAIATPALRPRRQLRAGAWAALLVATRPEAAPLALLLGVSVAHAAGSLGALPSLARATLPTMLFLAAQAAANRALTGELAAAGAVRKLVGSSPYLAPIDVAGEVIKNLVALRAQALESAMGGPRASWIVPILGLAALLDRRARRLAIPLLLGAYGALLLASLNATARFQNLRYAAPSILMLVVAAAIGAGALARRRGAAPLAAGLVLAAVIAPIGWFPRQIDHFARASRNIAEQQVEVARRLADASPRPRRVLVGDAGAIPYLSGLDAIDGLGLGGYRGMPFARASVHGIPAVIELLERLPQAERPDVLALYPSWWLGLADVFGRRSFGVRIEDNVICAADEKVVYDADWSALAPANEARDGALDELDVADLVSERAHAYAFPAPRGGWVIGAVLALPDGRARFDAGRIVPEGRGESFVLARGVREGPAALVLRTDAGGPVRLRVAVDRAGVAIGARELDVPARAEGRWHEVRAELPSARAGDRVTVTAEHGSWRNFHAWLVRE